MKKLLFLTVLVMALVCLLTFAVSADSINPSTSDAYGTFTTFDEAIGNTQISNLKDDGTVARAVITDGNGNYYTVPTVYLLTEHSKDRGDGVKGEMFNLKLSEITSKIGFSVSKNSIIRIEFPSDIKFICSGDENLSGCANLVECIMNDGVYFWDNAQRKAFTNCKKLKSIDISGMIIDQSQGSYSLFEYCESLEYVKLPNAYQKADGTYMDYSTNYMFHGCNKLKTIENMEGFFKGDKILNYRTFSNCYALERIVLPDGLQEIEGRAIGACKAITSIVIPDTVTKIGTTETVFESCTSLKTVVLPNNTVSFGAYCFEKCTALEAVWMPAQATFDKQVFGQCGSSLNVTFYFATATNTITVSNTDNNKDPYITAINNANGDARLKYSTPLSTKCTVFLGGHSASDATNDCTSDILCKACEIVMVEANAEHDIVKTLVYPNGFDNKGLYSCYCSRTGCDMIDEDTKKIIDQEVDEIITFLGYSVPETAGVKGINAGFKVEKNLLDDYNDINDVDATLTLFMVNCKNDEVNISKIFKDGTLDLETGVKGINVAITSTSYTNISVEVRGFDNSTEKGNYYTLKLITAIAVKTEEGTHFVQAGLEAGSDKQAVDGVDFNIVSAENVYDAVAE